MWQLLITLIQGYNEKKQVKQRIQSEQVNGKTSTTKCNVTIRAFAERWKKVSVIKERFPALHRDEEKGALGKKSHSAKLFCKRHFCVPRKQLSKSFFC